jgi:hypothetical protein
MAFENRGLCLGRTLSTIILFFCNCRYVAFHTYKDLAQLHFDLVYSSNLTTFDIYVSECSFCCLTLYGCSLPRLSLRFLIIILGGIHIWPPQKFALFWPRPLPPLSALVRICWPPSPQDVRISKILSTFIDYDTHTSIYLHTRDLGPICNCLEHTN